MTNTKAITFSFNEQTLPRRLFMFALGVEVFLVLLDAIVNYGKFTDIGSLRRLSNIAREDGVATWFASTQTLFAGLTAMLVYVMSKQMGLAKKHTIGWLIIALFFIYMAIDDGAQIHERVGTAFKVMAERGNSSLLAAWLHISPSYTWQLVFLPIFGVIGLYMSYFLWTELKESKARLLVFLALAFMGTAVILDFIEGLDKTHPWNIYTYIRDDYDLRSYTVSHFAKVLEEFLEMLSISTFWLVFTKQALHVLKETNIKVQLGN
jgi:hypothetical membrane protein